MNDADTDTAAKLEFLPAARAAFEFLHERGFREKKYTETAVRFESPTVFVDVFRDPPSAALGLTLGRLGHDGYTLAEALVPTCGEQVSHARFQATTPELLGAGLSRFAELLRTCCSSMLDGDSAAFVAVEGPARMARSSRTLDAQFHDVRRRANTAWSARDHTEALRLYREMMLALTGAERKRLEYLERWAERGGTTG